MADAQPVRVQCLSHSALFHRQNTLIHSEMSVLWDIPTPVPSSRSPQKSQVTPEGVTVCVYLTERVGCSRGRRLHGRGERR